MLRIGGPNGGTIGLLAWSEAKKEGALKTKPKHNRSIHVELSTDDLDGLYKRLLKKGVKFHTPPHDEPWERSATAFDPDGYSVEFSQVAEEKNNLLFLFYRIGFPGRIIVCAVLILNTVGITVVSPI